MLNIVGNKEDLELYNEKGIRVYESYTLSDDGYFYEKTYDKNGKSLTGKGSNGYWSKYTRDKKGNELTYENYRGDWCKYTRDEQGKELTYEDSNGIKRGFMKNILGNQEDLEFYNKEDVKVYEFYTLSYRNSYENTYDKNGEILTGKCSDGHWSKYTRDEQGNELTYEDSNGAKRILKIQEFTMEELVKKLGDFKLIK